MQAARQIQKVHMEKVQYARDYVEATQHLYPDLAEEVMSIYTRGEMPTYRPSPAKPVPDDGYPHNSAQTLQIIESMWEDIRQHKVILCATSSLIYGGRLEYTPTTSVPKWMPDWTFSDKSRTISDLRRVNLRIDTAEFFPIWLPDVEDITERVLRKQRQFPCVPVQICRRDISNAFKRVPLRPDFCAIFRHQFDAENIKTWEDITLAWLAPLSVFLLLRRLSSRFVPKSYNGPALAWGRMMVHGRGVNRPDRKSSRAMQYS